MSCKKDWKTGRGLTKRKKDNATKTKPNKPPPPVWSPTLLLPTTTTTISPAMHAMMALHTTTSTITITEKDDMMMLHTHTDGRRIHKKTQNTWTHIVSSAYYIHGLYIWIHFALHLSFTVFKKLLPNCTGWIVRKKKSRRENRRKKQEYTLKK